MIAQGSARRRRLAANGAAAPNALAIAFLADGELPTTAIFRPGPR